MISTDDILKELADLWVSLGKSVEGDAGAGVLRACSMTLIVMTEESDDAQALGETIASLMPEHPARAIVIRLRAGGDGSLGARVFSQCWMPFGQRRQICCEQVEITAADAALGELPSVLLPLCVPDLPVILYCRSARLAAMPEFEALARIARKVIVYSTRLGPARVVLPRLAATARGGLLIGDLAWTRLTRWRETLARLFENREHQSRIGELSQVQVCYGGSEPPSIAWYMGTWLAGALRAAGVEPQLKLQHDPNAPDAGINSVQLRGADPQALSVTLLVKGEALTLKVDGLSQCTALSAPSEYLLLREELGIVLRDPIFENTLSSAARNAVSSVDE